MQSDGSTLPDAIDESLLRAGFDDSPAASILGYLRSPRPRRRVLALRAGARRALLNEDHWLEALGDPSSEVRLEATNLLAYEETNDPRIDERLSDLLGDEDALVVESAAFALGEHGDVGAVELLSTVALVHEDARCREAAVAALGALGDDRGRPAILAALGDKPTVRRRAIVALSNFEGPDIDAALASAREDRDWQVRSAVDQLTRDEAD